MSKEYYSTSGELMEDIRKLDCKQQFKVCEAFYQIMQEEGFEDDSEMGLRSQDTFTEINP